MIKGEIVAAYTSMQVLPVRSAGSVVVVLEVCAERLSVVARLLVHEHDVSIVHSVQLQMGCPSASASRYGQTLHSSRH